MTIQELYQMRRKTPRFSHGDIRRNVIKKTCWLLNIRSTILCSYEKDGALQ